MATLYIPELRMAVTVPDDANVSEVRAKYLKKPDMRYRTSVTTKAYQKQYRDRNNDIPDAIGMKGGTPNKHHG